MYLSDGYSVHVHVLAIVGNVLFMIYTCTCHDKYCVHVLVIIGITVSEDPVPMPHLQILAT